MSASPKSATIPSTTIHNPTLTVASSSITNTNPKTSKVSSSQDFPSPIPPTHPQMIPESPRGALVLPPPLSQPSIMSTSPTAKVGGDLTLPPLSTVSPLSRSRPLSGSGSGPGRGGLSLSSLIHSKEPTTSSPQVSGAAEREREWKKRDKRESSPVAGPGPSSVSLTRPYGSIDEDRGDKRVVRGRQSLPERSHYEDRQGPGKGQDGYHQDRIQYPPLFSTRPHDPPKAYAPRRPIPEEPRRSVPPVQPPHPQAGPLTYPPPFHSDHSRLLKQHTQPQHPPQPPQPQQQSQYHQHPQTEPQSQGRGHGQWSSHPQPYPPHGQGQGHESYPSPRRRGSNSEAWFALGDVPPRQQYGWSRDRVEGYHAGWEDALRSVEAGVFGIRGQQYTRPILVRKDIPPPSVMTHGPPPRLRQSSSSDPGPVPLYRPPPPQSHTHLQSHSQTEPQGQGPNGVSSRGGSFEAPPPIQPRSMSFSSHPLPSPGLGLGFGYGYRRPSTSTSTTLSISTAHHRGSGPVPGILQERHSYSSTSGISLSPTSPNSALSTSASASAERKRRQAISCYPCRGRKLKCDGEKPCSQCVRRGGKEGCEYAHSVRRRGKGKKGKSEDGEDEEGERYDEERSMSAPSATGPSGRHETAGHRDMELDREHPRPPGPDRME